MDIINRRQRDFKIGDKILITKPLGTQGIMAVSRIIDEETYGVFDGFKKSDIENSISLAEKAMSTSLQNVAKTINEYGFKPQIRAMTDITGFGLNGHLSECLEKSEFSAKINSLPVFPFAVELSDMLGFNLREGKSSETAGPMCVIIDSKNYEDFVDALHSFKVEVYEIGEIVERKSEIIEIAPQITYKTVEKFGQ